MPAAKEYTTTKRNGCVKLRKEESGLGSEEPISVPTLLQDAASAYPDVSHFIQPILSTQSGHSQTKQMWRLGNKYYHSIKVYKYLRGPESVSIEIPPFRPKFT